MFWLDEAEECLNSVLAIASHDLRNSFSAIRLSASLPVAGVAVRRDRVSSDICVVWWTLISTKDDKQPRAPRDHSLANNSR